MIRKATAADCEEIFDLLYVIFMDMELAIFDHLSKEELKDLMCKAMKKEGYRYHHHHGLVYEEDGKVVGAIFGYPGAIESTIDDYMDALYREYQLTDLPPIFADKETYEGEFYLDSVAVDPSYRGKGIGSALLSAMPDFARERGAERLGLNCDFQNPKAEKLYHSLGFEYVQDWKIGSHVYKHMQLPL